MRRLKVLFITSTYPTEDEPVRGVFVKEQAKAVSLYNDVVIVHLQGWDSELKRPYEYKEDVEDGIRTIRLKFKSFPIPKISFLNYLLVIISVFTRLARQKFKPDVIHAHIYSSGAPAVIIGKLFRIPVVITEHFSSFPRRLLSKKDASRARFSLGKANLVISVSNALRRGIESYGIKNRFEIIPNVVDTSLFHYDGRIKKDVNVKRILLVALLRPIKGVPYLLQALQILRTERDDFVLDIVGDGPNRTEYEELAFRLGISDKVCFHGIKSKQEVAEFMRKSHFFVLPSLYETFGVVLIEALASGLPVIASNIGGPSEIINEELGIRVPPRDSHALAEAVENMLDHFHEYPSDRLAEHAQQTYSYETVGRKLSNIYQEMKS